MVCEFFCNKTVKKNNQKNRNKNQSQETQTNKQKKPQTSPTVLESLTGQALAVSGSQVQVLLDSGVQEAPRALGLSLHPHLAPQLSGLLFLRAKAQEPGASSALQLGLDWGGGGKLCSRDVGSHAPGPS